MQKTRIRNSLSCSESLKYTKQIKFRRDENKRHSVSKDSSDEDFFEINPRFLKSKTQFRASNKNQNNEFIEPGTNKMQPNWSNGLPYEVLLKIFTYFMDSANGNLNELKRVRYVCKYWSIVSQDSQLWKNINLPSILPTNAIKYGEKIFKKKMEQFIEFSLRDNKFLHLEKLKISNQDNITCDHIHSILANCNSKILLELSLTSCKKIDYSSKNLQVEKVIGENCPNLRSLDLSQNEVSLSFNLIIITMSIFY